MTKYNCLAPKNQYRYFMFQLIAKARKCYWLVPRIQLVQNVHIFFWCEALMFNQLPCVIEDILKKHFLHRLILHADIEDALDAEMQEILVTFISFE